MNSLKCKISKKKKSKTYKKKNIYNSTKGGATPVNDELSELEKNLIERHIESPNLENNDWHELIKNKCIPVCKYIVWVGSTRRLSRRSGGGLHTIMAYLVNTQISSFPYLIPLIEDFPDLVKLGLSKHVPYLREISVKFELQHPEIIEYIIVYVNINGFKLISDEFQDKYPDIVKRVLSIKGLLLLYISQNLYNIEFIKIAIAQNPLALQYVSPEIQTQHIEDLVLPALSINGLALEHFRLNMNHTVSPELIYRLMLKAVQQNTLALQFVSPEIQTQHINDLVLPALNRNGLVLRFVCPELMDNIVLHECAVLQNGWAIGYVPVQFWTNHLIFLAVNNIGDVLIYILNTLPNYHTYMPILIVNRALQTAIYPDDLYQYLSYHNFIPRRLDFE